MPRATPDRRRTKLTVQAEVTEGEPGPDGTPEPADTRPQMTFEMPDGKPVTLRFDVKPRD